MENAKFTKTFIIALFLTLKLEIASLFKNERNDYL